MSFTLVFIVTANHSDCCDAMTEGEQVQKEAASDDHYLLTSDLCWDLAALSFQFNLSESKENNMEIYLH